MKEIFKKSYPDLFEEVESKKQILFKWIKNDDKESEERQKRKLITEFDEFFFPIVNGYLQSKTDSNFPINEHIVEDLFERYVKEKVFLNCDGDLLAEQLSSLLENKQVNKIDILSEAVKIRKEAEIEWIDECNAYKYNYEQYQSILDKCQYKLKVKSIGKSVDAINSGFNDIKNYLNSKKVKKKEDNRVDALKGIEDILKQINQNFEELNNKPQEFDKVLTCLEGRVATLQAVFTDEYKKGTILSRRLSLFKNKNGELSKKAGKISSSISIFKDFLKKENLDRDTIREIQNALKDPPKKPESLREKLKRSFNSTISEKEKPKTSFNLTLDDEMNFSNFISYLEINFEKAEDKEVRETASKLLKNARQYFIEKNMEPLYKRFLDHLSFNTESINAKSRPISEEFRSKMAYIMKELENLIANKEDEGELEDRLKEIGRTVELRQLNVMFRRLHRICINSKEEYIRSLQPTVISYTDKFRLSDEFKIQYVNFSRYAIQLRKSFQSETVNTPISTLLESKTVSSTTYAPIYPQLKTEEISIFDLVYKINNEINALSACLSKADFADGLKPGECKKYKNENSLTSDERKLIQTTRAQLEELVLNPMQSQMDLVLGSLPEPTDLSSLAYRANYESFIKDMQVIKKLIAPKVSEKLESKEGQMVKKETVEVINHPNQTLTSADMNLLGSPSSTKESEKSIKLSNNSQSFNHSKKSISGNTQKNKEERILVNIS